MPQTFSALFGLLFKYRPAVFEQGDLAFGAPAPGLMVLTAGVVITALAVLSYTVAGGESTSRDRWVLGGLRAAALLVLVVCLLRPKLLLNAAVPQRNFVGVLVDDSRSMRIEDRSGRSRSDVVEEALGGRNATLLAALRSRFQVRLFRFGATTERIDSVSGLAFAAGETRLGDAIEGAQRELEALPVSGLVVFTDGADNARTPIADQLLSLRAKSIPVFTVGLGAERFETDIEVRRVEAARSVLRGSTLVADVLVRQRGFRGATVPLVVEDEGRVVSRTDVVLPSGGDAATVRVRARLDEAGPRTLTFRIPLQRGEQVTENNAQRAIVRVREGPQKILYVEGEPRHEMRFIRAAVEADSNLQLVALQRTAENKFLRLGVDGPEELLAGFPRTRAELFTYRGVVLGSIEASFFTHDQLAMLADFVSVRGGGLLALGGRRGFGEGGYDGTPLAAAMPVEFGRSVVSDSVTFLADLKPSLTPAGESHAVTQLPGGSAPLAARWAAMPAVTSVNRIIRVKPGAVILLTGTVTPAGRGGEMGATGAGYEQPVLAYQRYGRGLSIALPIQDSWTWQMSPEVPLGDASFATFWRQLLRWLASDAPGRATIVVAPDQADPRGVVELRAQVVDSAYVGVDDAKVVAHIAGPVGPPRDISLDWVVERDGEYRGSFTPGDTGRLVVRVDAEVRGASTASDTTFVESGEQNLEYVDAEMRARLLRRIATETGGRFYTPSTVAALPEDLALSKRGVTVVNQMDLWDMPVNLLLLLALVSAEWAYRKRRGLA